MRRPLKESNVHYLFWVRNMFFLGGRDGLSGWAPASPLLNEVDLNAPLAKAYCIARRAT
jgi:hypothetical protein